MDPDDDSLTAPGTPHGSRSRLRRPRSGSRPERSDGSEPAEARLRSQAAGSRPTLRSKAQVDQDAWVARWPGWAEQGGPPPVPPGPPSSEPVAAEPPVRRWRNPVLVVLCSLLGIGIIGGTLVDVPYVALVPGTARDTEPLLAVDGLEEYPSQGEVLFTTVRVRQRPNLWEYLWLNLDSDATVVPERQLLGDRSIEENRELNLSMMSDSKQLAVAVALEELGYDAIGTDGVVVQRLVPDTPADAVMQLGDTIVAIDGRATMATSVLVDILSGHQPGDRIELTVENLDGADPRAIEVTLAENPERPGAGFLGIQPADRIRYGADLDFEVAIDSGSVGGPSAGLAFTLAVLDQLTEGELTGGRQVAVTGTIQADGTVGSVGGVLQKTVAVRDLGVEVFLVPAGLDPAELEAIQARAGDELMVMPVADLDQALEALGDLGGDVGAVEEFAAGNPSAG